MEFSSAVYVKDACKSYGSKPILKNLNMHVEKGHIYGLLGASGCGKTTLLSCIVGGKYLHSGEIRVLGGKPGTKDSGVPGPKVGFMPQDVALIGELTTQDSLYFFGRLMEMPDGLIKKRFEELSEVLDLPPKDRFVKNCSGGQKRRISLACSMVHMPELLILDEPTAGVDPVLRERIWNYLAQVTKCSNMAVIITTHYIEETRQADIIGLMRDGRLLAQESPENLLNMFRMEYLEDVFLLLSRSQEAGDLKEIDYVKQSSTSDLSSTASSLDISYGSTNVLTEVKSNTTEAKHVSVAAGYTLNRKRIMALTDKNWKMFYRNTPGIVFTGIFPILQLLTFLLAVGQDVKSISLAIVNAENTCSNFSSHNATAFPFNETSCQFENVGCRFLTYLNHPMINKVDYSTLDEAFDGARLGKVVGALHMAENFTKSFEDRFNLGRLASSEVISFGQIKVWLDMSNRQIGETMKYKLFSLYKDFQEDVIKDCNMDAENNNLINLETINGDKDDTMTIYMVPGAILTIMFFISNVNTCDVVLLDRCEGVWDRVTVAGVSSLELILTHFFLQSVIALIYTLEVLAITFCVFNIDFVGSLWTMALITYLQGVAGIFYGFLISTVSNGYTMAHLISTGNFFLMIFCCGFMWPLEGMPFYLRWFANSLPLTIATQSFRNVMKRGWTIDHLAVLNGIGIEMVWIFGTAVSTVYILKSQR